jgi:hypothetical protein
MGYSLGIRFLVECKNHLIPFVGTKIDTNTLEGYPENQENLSLKEDKDLNIYLLLGDLKISAVGRFIGKNKNIYRFFLRQHQFDKRKHIRFNIKEKNFLCFLDNIRCKPIDISLDAIRFSAKLPREILKKFEKEYTLTLIVKDKDFNFRGYLKVASERDEYIFLFDKKEAHKVLKLLDEIMSEEKC